MARRRTSSRLQRIEDRKNRQQAILFVLLSFGFLLLLVFVGFPLFVKGAVFLGDLRDSGTNIDSGDKNPPIPPRLIAEYEATSSAQVKLEGYAEPASTVTLFKNNDKYNEAVTDGDGTFVFETVNLKKGQNHFYIYATDGAGNKSQDSPRIYVSFDDEAPDLSISNPEDGASFYDDEEEIVIAGKTDPEANVKVNGYVVVVDNEGNFVKRYKLLTGENEIEVVAIDDAGNTTKKSIKVSYSR